MKNLLFAIALLAAALPVSAQKFMTKTGHISFVSKTPLENFEAHNRQVTSILDSQTGDMVFAVLMKSFQFENAFMQEHFNEKYVESDKFPKATFQGKISNLSDVNFKKDGTYKVTVAGNLTMHGVTKPVTSEGTVTVAGGNVSAQSKLSIRLADYNVEIPAPVRQKVSEVVETTVDMSYAPYNAN